MLRPLWQLGPCGRSMLRPYDYACISDLSEHCAPLLIFLWRNIMTKITHHLPLSPTTYRLQQIIMALLFVVMAGAVGGLLFLAFLIPAPLMILMALMVGLLMGPVAMLLSVSPPITIDENGLTLQPFWGKAQQIAWNDIASMQVYPLLPQTDQEVERRLMQGRKKYRAAEGYMLLVPRLPMRYRVAGLFAGVGGQPIVAFTNRAHSDYETLLQRVRGHVEVKTEVNV